MSKILEKIKKLLRLSEDGSNEHVAEAAAQKAQELIEEHNIKGEMLMDEEQNSRESPDWQGYIFRNKRVYPWAVNLCSELAEVNYGVVGIMPGKGVEFCGSKRDFDVVCTMYRWIVTQLHSMATNKCHGVREHNSYKLGAVATINKRLRKAKADAKARMEVEEMMANWDGKCEIVSLEGAIAALDAYKDESLERARKDFGSSWRGAGVSADQSAYSMGAVDGNSVSLSGHQIGG